MVPQIIGEKAIVFEVYFSKCRKSSRSDAGLLWIKSELMGISNIEVFSGSLDVETVHEAWVSRVVARDDREAVERCPLIDKATALGAQAEISHPDFLFVQFVHAGHLSSHYERSHCESVSRDYSFE
jgi:hypothetical protein